jgi:hypothetical protein
MVHPQNIASAEISTTKRWRRIPPVTPNIM